MQIRVVHSEGIMRAEGVSDPVAEKAQRLILYNRQLIGAIV